VSEFRCGFVALLGRPNAGKSTLMNALVGEKLAIISARAQTTRGRILGVLTRPHAQLIFCDTPGVHRGRARFNLAMTESALRAAEDADVRLLLLDAAATWDAPEETLSSLPSPLLLVRTKLDTAQPGPVPDLSRFDAVFEVSAESGAGLEGLLAGIEARLPVGPPLYPEDYLTDRSLRFLAAEQVREVAFEIYRDEIPYAIAVEVEEWKQSDDSVRVRANVLVERENQKAIVVGQGGRMLKTLGSESRRRLAEWLDTTVHLNLWVKTDRNWSHRPRRAKQLGYLD